MPCATHAILRPARVDGWWDPDPMAMVPPGEPGEPADFPNRCHNVGDFVQKTIIFGYFLHFDHCREGFKAIFKAAFLHFDHCRGRFTEE